MHELDQLYLAILHRGLISIRNASWNGDIELCKAHSEYLHEVPSLIGETNMHRHIYQAEKVGPAFLAWAKVNDRHDVLQFVNTYYAYEWKQIDRILGIDPPKETERGQW